MAGRRQPRRLDRNIAYFDEPPERRPPITEVGPLAWVRANLFGSPLDTALTLLAALFLVAVCSFLLNWSIGTGNWYSIIFNLRLFLVGRVEAFMDPRITFLFLFIAVLAGVNFAAWSRIHLRLWTILAGVLLSLFVIPWLIASAIPLPPTWLAAGQREVTSGSITARPLERIAFIAGAEEEVAFRLVRPADDAELAQLTSFSDVMTNTLRNAAANRLGSAGRLATIERELAGDRLTGRQRAAHEEELGKTEVPPPVHSTYEVSAYPVLLTLLSGETGEEIFSRSLAPGEELRQTLPRDGWYVLEKRVADSDDSIALLRASGLYPIFDRSFIREGERAFQYMRATDRLLVEGGRPRDAGGADLPMLGIIDHQYRGERPLADFLRLMLGPFLGQLNLGLTLFVAFMAAAYAAAQWLRRRDREQEAPLRRVRRSAVWLWLVTIPLAFLLIAGFGEGGVLRASDPQLWGGLLLTLVLTVVALVAAFPIGILLALGRRSALPVVSAASTLYIEVFRGVPLITLLFMSMLLVQFVLPGLGGPDNAPYRVMVALILFSAAYLAEDVRGGLQSLPPGQVEAARALGLPAWRITLHITLPQALRAVIPAMVGQFISLFKDTSLVTIVGLIDLTGVANLIASQTEFQGLRRETYIFIAILYFIFSSVMSNVSRRIEASGSGAARA
ncbi:MAG: amino acid ABC transporter permease [Anaerolineaceae bacterium]|nr:amino acid ABC transporter permease [Anaerolineaceae bacterium]